MIWRFELIHVLSLCVFVGVLLAWPHLWLVGFIAGFGLEMCWIFFWMKHAEEPES